MAYRKVYLRVRTEVYASGWSSDSDKAAFKEESRRLCDKDRRNKIGNQFVAKLMDGLLQKGWLVSAETSQGEGIRTAADKERGARQVVTQVAGQITMEGQPSPPEKAPKRKSRLPPACRRCSSRLGAFFVLRSVHIGAYAWFVSESLVVMVIAFVWLSQYTCFTIKKGDNSMRQRKNLCAQVPIILHNRLMEVREQLGQTTAEYITNLLTEYYEIKENGGNTAMINGKNRTMAFQIDEELFQRIKAHLDRESARLGRKVTQREFVLGLIEGALNTSEPMDVDETGVASCEAPAAPAPKGGRKRCRGRKWGRVRPNQRNKPKTACRFTSEEMSIAKETDLPDLLSHLDYQVRRLGSYHTTKEMDSIRIKERRRWRHYFTGQGGDAITFL